MGLFDMLNNITPEQGQNLLGLATGLLQASGPSTRPMGFGQVLGAGLQGLQQAQAAGREQQMQALQAKLMGFKVQDAESDLQNQQAARARAKALQDFYSKRGAGAGAAATDPAALLGGNAAPTVANADRLASMPAATGGAGGAGGTMGLFQQRLAEAADLRANGFGQEADAAEAAAIKLQPQVDAWKEVQVGNETRALPVFKDGSYGVPVPLQLAVKLEQMKNGGSTDLYNPMTGAVARTVKTTMTPAEAARIGIDRAQLGLSAQRLAMEKDAAGKPTYHADAGGFVLPPSAANPTGKLIPLAGVAGKAPTEFQGKSAAFGLRATEADKIISGLEGKYSPASINAKASIEGLPLIGGALGAMSNFGMSDAEQRAEQSQRDFVNAILRQESGAAIGPDEFNNARKQYFPQPGDGAAVVQQKKRNRALAIQGLQSNAGRAALAAPGAQPAAAPAGGVKFLGFE